MSRAADGRNPSGSAQRTSFGVNDGALIGISTVTLHARGPMSLEELTSRKYVLIGDGQVRV